MYTKFKDYIINEQIIEDAPNPREFTNYDTDGYAFAKWNNKWYIGEKGEGHGQVLVLAVMDAIKGGIKSPAETDLRYKGRLWEREKDGKLQKVIKYSNFEFPPKEEYIQLKEKFDEKLPNLKVNFDDFYILKDDSNIVKFSEFSHPDEIEAKKTKSWIDVDKAKQDAIEKEEFAKKGLLAPKKFDSHIQKFNEFEKTNS